MAALIRAPAACGRPVPSDGADDELALIARCFAPLAKHPAARGLKDDVAVLEAQGALVVTVDSVVEGVHFLASDPIETIARKALRVNVSDLTAKGAAPFGVLVSLQWPRGRPASEAARFAAALGEDLDLYGAALLGGDTTQTPGPLAISVTALGRPLGERTPARDGAASGEDLWVTGVIGDAALGLKAALGEGAHWDDADRERLLAAYRVPDPPLAFAGAIATFATASLDVSDGLLLDAFRLAQASDVACVLDLEVAPYSAEALRWMAMAANEGEAQAQLLSGGDDYQVLFTAPLTQRDALQAHARLAQVRLTRIGAVENGCGLFQRTSNGERAPLAPLGYRHPIGR